MIYEFCRAIAWICMKVFFRLKAVNLGNVPKTGGFMMICNHASYLDPMLAGSCVRRHINYLAKIQLFQIPLFGQLLPKLHAHPIKREGMDRDALRECVEIMRGGEILLIFPEGTRTSTGDMQDAKPGAAMIAAQADAACIPVYIEGSFDAWSRHQKLPRLGKKVRVYYGKPFTLPRRAKEMPVKEYYRLCADEMRRRIEAERPGQEPVSVAQANSSL